MRALPLIFATLLIGTVPPARADDDKCAPIGRIAEAVMQRRQDNLSLQSTLDAIRQTAGESSQPILEELILRAYEQPLFRTADNRARAVGEFRDQEQLACMKLLRVTKPPA